MWIILEQFGDKKADGVETFGKPGETALTSCGKFILICNEGGEPMSADKHDRGARWVADSKKGVAQLPKGHKKTSVCNKPMGGSSDAARKAREEENRRRVLAKRAK